MSDRQAHTAEHAFIGALQKILGTTLRVRKVEHKGDGTNTAFIALSQLDIDTVIGAENMVNSLIAEGRVITARTYPSLEEAKRQNLGLRANEERISATGEVRVVEIEGHDVTACAIEHVSNLCECDFFLVTRMSKTGGDVEVDFVVGQRAREAAVALSARMMKVCEELGANLNTVEATARKVRAEGESSSKKLKTLSREVLAGMAPVTTNNATVFKGIFSGLDDEAVVEFAGARIASPGTVVIIANRGQDAARFVFARSENLGIDCNKIFRETAGADGKGGGKPNFVTGVLKDRIEEIVDGIALRLS